MIFNVENAVLHSKCTNNSVTVKYKKNAFSLFLDISVRNEYLKLFEAIDESQDIKGVAIINDTDFDDVASVKEFLELVRGSSSSDFTPGVGFYKENIIAKFRSSFGRIMLSSINLTKPLVAGIHGGTTGEYLGSILPFDSRFATPETCFTFNNASLGLPVSPGLSYFLPRFIGQGKALEFIHHTKTISAKDALSLGLITDIVPHDKLQARCIEEVELLSSATADVAVTNRMLLNPDTSEFEHHLERYYNALGRLVHIN